MAPGPAARRELGPAPVAPGPGAEAGSLINLHNPIAVVRIYLLLAHGTTPRDAGRTNRRATAYMDRRNPAYTIGLPVLEAPPAGQTVTVEVSEVRLWGADAANQRRAYQAHYRLLTVRAGQAGPGPWQRTYVVLAVQGDGSWQVIAETARLDPAED